MLRISRRSVLVFACLIYTSNGAHIHSSRQEAQRELEDSQQNLVDPSISLALALLANVPSLEGNVATSRRHVVGSGLAAAAALGVKLEPALAEEKSGTTANGVQWKILEEGGGPGAQMAKNGDLVGAKFKGTTKGLKKNFVFDDLMAKDEPYFFRIGNGNVVPGVEEIILMMKPGALWEIEVPSAMGFGEEGKKQMVGVPRIPPNTDLSFTVELTTIPGKDPDYDLDDK
jgi:FKBP-type peptidyl-prolyl cis-trans isomerase